MWKALSPESMFIVHRDVGGSHNKIVLFYWLHYTRHWFYPYKVSLQQLVESFSETYVWKYIYCSPTNSITATPKLLSVKHDIIIAGRLQYIPRKLYQYYVVFVLLCSGYILQGNITCHNIDDIMRAMESQITSLTIVYTSVYAGTDQRKHQSSAVTGEFPAQKWPSTRKMIPFDDVIMLSDSPCLSAMEANHKKML